MTRSRHIVSTVSLAWGALAFVPLVVLAHSEYRGVTEGWIHASLHPEEELYSWARNRLVVWAALYAVGSFLLWKIRRNDPDGARIGQFASTVPARLLVLFLVLLFLVVLTFAEPAELALVALAVLVGFLSIWAFTRSAESLTLAVGRALTLAFVFTLLLFIGEAVLRIPSIVERTGGSLEARSELWNKTDFRKVTSENSFQLRSRHIGRTKAAGVTRILAVGDSFTAGDWVDSIDDAWPYAMEAAFRRTDKNVEVVNIGFGGATTESEAEFLSDLGWLLQPDILILQYTLNDTQDDAESVLPLVPLLDSGLRRKSHLYSFLNARFRALQISLFRPVDLSPYFRDDYPGWHRSRAALEDITERARLRSVPVLFVLYPWLTNDLDDDSYPYLEVHQKLAKTAETLGVPILDTRPLLAEANPHGRAWWAREFDSHPNAEAHRIVGEAVARKIIDLGYLR